MPDAGAWSNVSLKAGMVSTEVSVSESGGSSEQDSRVAGEQSRILTTTGVVETCSLERCTSYSLRVR